MKHALHVTGKMYHNPRQEQVVSSWFHILEYLYLVIDGGTKGDLGSFSWEFAIRRTILWMTCINPTFGRAPDSCWVKSYRMLSVMPFLYHYLSDSSMSISQSTLTIYFIMTIKAFSNKSDVVPWTGPGTIQTIAWLLNTTWSAASLTSYTIFQSNYPATTSKATKMKKLLSKTYREEHKWSGTPMPTPPTHSRSTNEVARQCLRHRLTRQLMVRHTACRAMVAMTGSSTTLTGTPKSKP